MHIFPNFLFNNENTRIKIIFLNISVKVDKTE